MRAVQDSNARSTFERSGPEEGFLARSQHLPAQIRPHQHANFISNKKAGVIIQNLGVNRDNEATIVVTVPQSKLHGF